MLILNRIKSGGENLLLFFEWADSLIIQYFSRFGSILIPSQKIESFLALGTKIVAWYSPHNVIMINWSMFWKNFDNFNTSDTTLMIKTVIFTQVVPLARIDYFLIHKGVSKLYTYDVITLATIMRTNIDENYNITSTHDSCSQRTDRCDAREIIFQDNLWTEYEINANTNVKHRVGACDVSSDSPQPQGIMKNCASIQMKTMILKRRLCYWLNYVLKMSRNNNVAGFKEPVYRSSAAGMNFLVFVNLTF